MGDTTPEARKGIAGLNVLVVEDEVAISLLIEDMLLELGANVIGPAGRLSQALSEIESSAPDVAILDVNVAGEPIYPVAEALRGRAIPFAFLTGYGAAGIDGEWRERPVLPKPFSQDELESLLSRLAEAAA